MKTLVTQHYMYTDDHVKDILFSVNWLLAHAHNMANDNRCTFKGEFMGLKGRNIVIYYKLQTVRKRQNQIQGSNPTLRCALYLRCTLGFDIAPLWFSGSAHLAHKICALMMSHNALCAFVLGAYDPHILDEMTLHDGPGIYLGEQPLSEGCMETMFSSC